MFDGLWQDIRIALRQIVHRPVWSLAIIIVLAVGIGANAAMFSSFEAWVLRPLDFADPERLVSVSASQPSLGRDLISVSAPDYGDWMARQASFQNYGAFDRFEFNLNDDVEPARIRGARVTASLFPMLGKRPVLGRSIAPDEDRPGQPGKVVLVSNSMWVERFEADPEVLGRTLRLDSELYEIIGVMEPGFAFPEWGDVWVPMGMDPQNGDRSLRWIGGVVARLEDGVTIESARAELEAIGQELAELYPVANRGYSVSVQPFRRAWVPPVIEVAVTASLLSGVLVLLVICANVASLMLAQAAARSRETAVRSALGAGRYRLMRQSVVEGVLLALPAAWLGGYLGVLGLRTMLAYVPVDPPYLFRMGFDPIAGVYTLVIAVFAGIVCGIVPVVRSSGARLYEALKTGGREGAGREKRGLRSMLVAGELALSTALLIGALLMVQSLAALRAQDPGFQTDDVLTAELSLRGVDEDDTPSYVRTGERILSGLSRVRGVIAAGATSHLPASNGYRIWGLVAQERDTPDADEDVQATVHAILGGYFETLRIPILAGRDFTDLEKREGGDLAIVSAGLADKLWGSRDVVGRRLRLSQYEEPKWLTVVGVTEDVRVGRDMVVSDVPDVQLYIPYGQSPTTMLALVVRTPAPESEAAAAMRDVFRASAPGVPTSEVLTMDAAIFRVRWVSFFFSRQLALYALLATIIAAVGLYGLTADGASRRTRELAIRTALGAERSALVGLVLKESLVLGAVGVGLGLILSFGVTGFAASMFSGVSVRDPWTYAVVGMSLLLVSVVAALLPARRASLLDPVRALRSE